MTTYNHSPWSSSDYVLGYLSNLIIQDIETLEECSRRVARLVYAGGLEFFKGWDALWLSAVAGGMPQLQAQQIIGEVFATVRQGNEVAA